MENPVSSNPLVQAFGLVLGAIAAVKAILVIARKEPDGVAQAYIAGQKEQNEQWKELLEAQTESLKDLKMEKAQVERKLEAVQAENSRLQTQVSTLTKRVNEQDHLIGELKAQLAEQGRLITELREKYVR